LTKKPKSKPLSLRAYAKHRGVSAEAVSKAITEGRLRESVTRVKGAPKIADAELADREWDANTRPRVENGPDHTEYYASRSRREAAQAELRELELARHKGELVPAKDFDAHLERLQERMRVEYARCRDKLLAIPVRARQRDASLTVRHLTLIDELVREALQDLSERDGQQR
jgi:phage terminase Nu1 subunit (DNA packaging protein)